MATKHLDLEEQEQLEELKHFWKKYGSPITGVLIAVLAVFASWTGYQYWQRNQAAQASVMYEEVGRAVESGDSARIDRSLADMKDHFGRTAFAQHAGLLAARAYHDKGNLDASKAALIWVATNGSDEGYQAIAKLRLAGIFLENKSYEEALKQVFGPFPKTFEALAGDRRGDILAAQGKKVEARAEYEKAFKNFDERAEYKKLLEIKLNALGVDVAGVEASSPISGVKP